MAKRKRMSAAAASIARGLRQAARYGTFGDETGGGPGKRPAARGASRGEPYGLRPQTRWATVRGPKALPCLWPSRQAANENRDADEYLVRVRVWPASGRDERW